MQQLNNKQLEAVKYTEGPLLVLAGAGTGKTKVLTNRISHIITEGLAYPGQILAVTFTNKAANEMKERIANLVDSYGLNIGTFHSMSAKILRQHAEYLNLTSNFTIINTDEQIKLVKSILKESNIDEKLYSPKIIHHIISNWKDMGLTTEKLSHSDIKNKIDEVAKQIYLIYQDRLIESNLVDFGDIILYCTELFINNPDIAYIYQNKFKYILIDEYQDINSIQYIWIRILANKYSNICCVGDDDQSIYSWRGAEIANILKFEQDFPQAKIIKLEQNYRSTTPILEAASSLINHNGLRHQKKLWSTNKEGSNIKVIQCFNEKEEAKIATITIQNILRAPENENKTTAILVRTIMQTRLIEEELISSQIPYRIIGGMKFYERAEIKDVLSYLRLTLNFKDNLAFERIINLPKRSFGKSSLLKLKDFSRANEYSFFEGLEKMIERNLLTSTLAKKMYDFIIIIKQYSEKFKDSKDIYNDIKEFLNDIGYIPMLKSEKLEENRTKLDNIYEMLKAITEYDSLSNYISHILLVSEEQAMVETPHNNIISLMTLHAAKGLEFNFVIIPGFEEDIFPHQRSINESGKKGLEEERRLAYVGITRAKEQLYIMHSQSRRSFGDFQYTSPSRFLSELPKEYLENYTVSQFLPTIQSKIFVKKSPKLGDIIIGKNIKHSTFGNGVIVKKEGDIYDVAFNNIGIKKIKREFIEA